MSVVGGGLRGSKVWRRERIEMTEADLDDVAFLSGTSQNYNSILKPVKILLFFKIYSLLATKSTIHYDKIQYINQFEKFTNFYAHRLNKAKCK